MGPNLIIDKFMLLRRLMETTLQDLLPASFTNLTESELKLLQKASEGKFAKFGTIDPAIDEQYGKDREIRAGLIRGIIYLTGPPKFARLWS
jgi:hypothetical protein